jgi:rhamnosyltransferase
MDVSVIVRVKDEVDSIAATLRALRGQTRPVELVVVDSGSRDGTLDIARAWADVVVDLAPEDFTYGRALNLGAAAASGRTHFALSAHCRPDSPTWIEDSLALYGDERVAGTCGALWTPDGRPMTGTYLPTLEEALRHPAWGFSNHASSWRADVWHSVPFREDLPACEDKEWFWRVLGHGHAVAFSPRVFVPAGHRREQGLGRLHRRVAREAEAMVTLGVARPLTAPDALRAWWGSFSSESRRSHLLRRLSPHRVAELTGAWAGGRAAATAAASSSAGEPVPAGSTAPPYLPWVPAQ